MNYIMRGHEFTNEVQTAIQIFFQNEKYTRVEIPVEDGLTIETLLIRTCFIGFSRNAGRGQYEAFGLDNYKLVSHPELL